MSVTYPLSLPAVKAPSAVTMTLAYTAAVARSPFTQESQAQEWPGQVWTVEARFPPMTRPDASAWLAFLARLRGRAGTFLMGDPAAKTPRGAATGTPLVDGAGQTGSDLATKGWTPSVTGILKAGDYVQIGSGLTARLFLVTADANSGADGKATLQLAPDVTLASSPADGAALVTANAVGLFRLDSNSAASWSIEEGKLYGFGFSATGEP